MGNSTKIEKLTIYFDGLCRVCSAEMDHYRPLAGAEGIEFIDIMDPAFVPEAHGLDPQKVHRVLHVRSVDGVLFEGVDAFRLIWRQLPRYRFLADASDYAPFRAILEMGYRVFVKVRPYLPRKKLDCSQSPYCEVPVKK